jgi:predicted nicotinamide N-methyase
MEIGAGLGLPGLLSAYYADAVWLTDFNTSVLHATSHNIELNIRSTQTLSDCLPAIVRVDEEPCQRRLQAVKMDWDKLDELGNEDSIVEGPTTAGVALPRKQSVDVVIGADVVYCKEAAVGVVASIKYFMAKGGVAIISATSSFTRFGIQFLPEAAAHEGLSCTKHPILELGKIGGGGC